MPCIRPDIPTVNISVDGKALVLPKHPIFATNENGITKTNSYQLHCTLQQESVIKATASHPGIKVEIGPIIEGRAILKCTYQGQEKVYYIN